MAETVTVNPAFSVIVSAIKSASGNMDANLRNAAKTLSARWVQIAQMEAPQKTGNFRKTIETQFLQGDAIGFEGFSGQPLGTFIAKGTKPHKIRARKAGALYFFWGKVGMFTVVPKAGGFRTHTAGGKLWIGKGYVDHPGTKPNDYVSRTFAKWEPEMIKEVEAVADKFVIDVVRA